MIFMNQSMSSMFRSNSEPSAKWGGNKTINEIVLQTLKIGECIIYAPTEELIRFVGNDGVLGMYGSYTDFEVSCNEIYIPCTLEGHEALQLVNLLTTQLLQKFPNLPLCIFLCQQDNGINLRFHTYRQNEGMWLAQDLDKYQEPVLCHLVNLSITD